MEDAPNPPKKAAPRTRRTTPAAAPTTPKTRPARSQVTARAEKAPAPVKRAPNKTITETIRPPKPPKAVKPKAPEPVEAPPVDPPLWAHLVADPGFAAEHVSREAARRLGPDARDWVQRMESRYPTAGPDALARLATMELIRTGRRQGAASGTGGAVGSWANVGLAARTQARMVLTLAAVYGLDPTSEDRARDLLELQRVPRLTQPATSAVVNGGRLLAAVAVRRIAARLMPFGAAVAGSIHSGRELDDLARRSITRFRTKG